MFRAVDATLAAVAVDRYVDATINLIADALAEYVDLFNQDSALIWVKAGKTTRVTPPVLAEIIPKHLATKHLENHGDEVVIKYVPLVLQDLRPFFSAERRTGSLIARVTKV
jgi:hypothetical protein